MKVARPVRRAGRRNPPIARRQGAPVRPLHTRADVGGDGVRQLHLRRVLPVHRGLAGRREHGDTNGAGNLGDGQDTAGWPPFRQARLPFRCRVAIHVDPLHRTPRRAGGGTVDRLGRGLPVNRPMWLDGSGPFRFLGQIMLVRGGRFSYRCSYVARRVVAREEWLRMASCR